MKKKMTIRNSGERGRPRCGAIFIPRYNHKRMAKMGRGLTGLAGLCAVFLLSGVSFAADAPATSQQATGQPESARAQDQAPEVPAAKPGVFTMQKKSGTRYHLVVKGHAFTSRDAIEKYLLYRAAELTLDQHDSWFTLIEARAKGDTAPPSKPDPEGLRFSFRMAYWRPVWHYKIAGAGELQNWSPFSGAAFPVTDPKTIADFEVDADIVLHKGIMNDADPLAFEAGAVSDLLVNQVSPPE
jgi:hypothetical protein